MADISDPEITSPTHQKMLKILSDGKPHSRHELHDCCGPSSIATVRIHIVRIRKYLRPQGQDIICELRHRQIHYRHIRLLLPD